MLGWGDGVLACWVGRSRSAAAGWPLVLWLVLNKGWFGYSPADWKGSEGINKILICWDQILPNPLGLDKTEQTLNGFCY